jgi:dihydrolipoamide dehydrogenase
LPNILPVEDEDSSKEVAKAFREKSGIRCRELQLSVESVDTRRAGCEVKVKALPEGIIRKWNVMWFFSAVGIQTNLEGLRS